MTNLKTSVLLLIAFALLLATHQLTAQNTQLKSPVEFMPNKGNAPEVLLVGTFHFSYPGLDAYKTKEEDKIDVLNAEYQKQVDELVEYIALFKPTKIAVETGQNTGYLMHDFREWQAGKAELKRNEVHQIALRLMQEFKLDTIYGTNAQSAIDKFKEFPQAASYIEEMFEDYDWKSDDPFDIAYDELYTYQDKVMKEISLLETFKYMNSDEMLKYYHGAYLIGDFKLEDYKGVDALATYWYSRNLRIFRNIQERLDATAEDRILVLYGAGHIPILKHLFECSPEYNLVNFNSLDK